MVKKINSLTALPYTLVNVIITENTVPDNNPETFLKLGRLPKCRKLKVLTRFQLENVNT